MEERGERDDAARLEAPQGGLAVVIPHYNDVARLSRCLAALLGNGAPAGAQIAVVDNGSSEDVAGAVAPYEGVRLIFEDERGAAAARNKGVRETTGETLVFLDADCVPQAGWWAALIAAHAKADLVGGEVSVFCESPPPRSGAEAFETVFAFNQKRYVEAVGFSVTANLITRRAVFEKVGGFRNGVSEDLDWCHRARDLGFSIAYAPEFAVAHPARADWGALRRKWRRLTEESYALHRANGGGRAAWLLRALAVAVSPLRDALAVLKSDKLQGAGERTGALAVLVAIRLQRAAWMVAQGIGLGAR